MIIDNKIFLSFLDKISLNGMVNSAILTADETGLSTQVIDTARTVVAKCNVPLTAITEINSGPVVLNIGDSKESSLTWLKKALKKYSDDIEVLVKNNVITIKHGRSRIAFPMVVDEYVRNNLTKELKYDFDNGFILPIDFIKQILKDIKLLDVKEVTFEIKDNKLFLSFAGSNSSIDEELEVDYHDCTVSFNSNIIENVLSVFETDVMLSIIDDKNPAHFVEVNQNDLVTSIIVAPIMTNEEEWKWLKNNLIKN